MEFLHEFRVVTEYLGPPGNIDIIMSESILPTTSSTEAMSGNFIHEELNREFHSRRANNPRYSIRAFARSLEMPFSTVKALLENLYVPTDRTISHLGRKLNWSTATTRKAIQDFRSVRKDRRSQRSDFDEAYASDYFLVADPAFLALRALGRAGGVSADLGFLSDCMGMPESKVKAALETLVADGYLEVKEGLLQCTKKQMFFPSNEETVGYTQSVFSEAAVQLGEVEDQDRASMLFQIATDEEGLAQLKKLMRALPRQVQASVKAGQSPKLMHVGAFFFPFRRS